MSKFRKTDTIGIIRGTGVVPVFYNADVELTKKVVKACYDGGIRAFEFTNRGDGAHRVFKDVIEYVRAECPEMAFGAGTILDAPTVPSRCMWTRRPVSLSSTRPATSPSS